MRALQTLQFVFGILFVGQAAFGKGKAKSDSRQSELARFNTEEAAKRAVGKQDWQGAVREYTKLIKLLPEPYRKNATEYKCPRATAYAKLGQLENASLDLSFEVDPIANENQSGSRAIPTFCLLARAELEEQKRNLDRAIYYYRLMARDDRNDEIAVRSLTRLKACSLVAFRVRGVAATDWRAVLKVIHPDIVVLDTADHNQLQLQLQACKRLCRIPNEDAAIRPNAAGGYYVFPGLFLQKESRCGGTNPHDGAGYLEDVFSWTVALADCPDGSDDSCPLACHEPKTATDAGWEIRTVAPDPGHADSVLVVDQRNKAAGPGASPGNNAYQLNLTADGYLAVRAPLCTRIPISNSQAGAPIQGEPPTSATPAAPTRHSFIPRMLRRLFFHTTRR